MMLKLSYLWLMGLLQIGPFDIWTFSQVLRLFCWTFQEEALFTPLLSLLFVTAFIVFLSARNWGLQGLENSMTVFLAISFGNISSNQGHSETWEVNCVTLWVRHFPRREAEDWEGRVDMEDCCCSSHPFSVVPDHSYLTLNVRWPSWHNESQRLIGLTFLRRGVVVTASHPSAKPCIKGFFLTARHTLPVKSSSKNA